MRTLEDWLKVTGIESGAILRSIKKGNKLQEERLTAQSVRLIVMRTALKAGLNAGDYGAHSLRSGFATQAAKNRAHLRKLMDQGWDSPTTVMGYIQEVELFDDNASALLGL